MTNITCVECYKCCGKGADEGVHLPSVSGVPYNTQNICNIMATDALAPCVAMSSSSQAIELVIAFNRAKCQPPVPFGYGKVGKSKTYFLCISKQIRQSGGGWGVGGWGGGGGGRGGAKMPLI